MKNIILFGGGIHVRYCIDIIEKGNRFNIVGITDPYLEIGADILGYKIIGRQEHIKSLVSDFKVEAGIVTIGDNWTRKIVRDTILEQIPDFEFVSAIHPSVILGNNVMVGNGTVIMAGCIISPNTRIGEFCFFASGAILEHDSIMEDFGSLSAGSVTGGKVIIRNFAAIMLGVIIFDRVTIGEHSVVGSGSLVTKDIPGYVIAYGSPARVIRHRTIGEKYLK
jgi:sugar O-acyltransferase (sialic acid O-acetyltransferase NeuD family)